MSTATAEPDNIVSLNAGENPNPLRESNPTAEKITSAAELEMRRKVFFRSVEIIGTQLDHDALKMEQSAIVGEHPIQRRHELMDMARSLRMTQTWLASLVTEPKDGPKEV